MKTIFLHVNPTENIGDMVSCPALYREQLGLAGLDLEIRDFRNYDWPQDANLVFGGGGLLCGEEFENGVVTGGWIERFASIAKPRNRQLITWGIGHNVFKGKIDGYSNWLSRFDLVGLRDGGNPFSFVPCASCMHEAFLMANDVPKGGSGFGLYYGFGSPLPDYPIRRKMNNDKRPDEMDSVVEFLAASDAVVTNSYHGAYWASLLSRPVVLFDDTWSRYHAMGPTVALAGKVPWDAVQEKLGDCIPRSSYLDECRQINIGFSKNVLKILNP